MNPDTFKISSELFLIPEQNDAYLVYAPQKRFFMRLDANHVNILNRIEKGMLTENDKDSDFVKSLIKCGIVNGKPDETEEFHVYPEYSPTQVTLFLTNQCNLKCKYCYAAKNDSDNLALPLEIGYAAVDFVVRNCIKGNVKYFTVTFHGGGEQTTAWDSLVSICDYAKEQSLKNSLKLNIGLASNGVFSEKKALWMVNNLSSVTLSVDGPPRIQDSQRPLKDGRKSSGQVHRTISIFKKHKFPYHIQSTVTSESVKSLPEIVRYFARHAKPLELKFEPAYSSGRCASTPHLVPGKKEFVQYYNKAWLEAKKLGIKLSFSGTRLFGPRKVYFCGAFMSPFSITPDGIVTSCFEICDANSEYREIFHIGKYDSDGKSFIIDDKALKTLRERSVHKIPSCQRCFCKYSCAGDCAIRNLRFFGTNKLNMVGSRCEVIRDITRFQMSYIMDRISEKPEYYAKKEAAIFGGYHERRIK
jgi:uncharacterized protein